MDCCLKVNCNISCDQLVLLCFPNEGAPRIKSIGDLQNDWGRLKAQRDQTERSILESRPRMLPTEQAKEWLRQVATLEGKIETLIRNWKKLHPRTDSTQETEGPEPVIQNGKCCCGYCSKCTNTCCLWGKIQSRDSKVLVLEKQKPGIILEKPQLPQALQMPTNPTTGMQLMLEEVWSHVVNQQDDCARLIGLYGMGGVGKTALLEAVNNKLSSSTLNFDLHLWIDVSESPNPVNIQNYIGENIGLCGDDWNIKSQKEKARNINTAINIKKYTYILLLDDLWKSFTFKEIGIPRPDSTNQSKVIFTTPYMQVCGQMKAKGIQVECLKDVEPWKLFKECIGETTVEDSNIENRARDVMEGCGGLPLAITVIGTEMNSKTAIHDWENAIQLLKGADFPNMADKVYTRLRRTYDNLANDDLRSCFLSCLSHGEDEEILKSELVDKWISEGFLGKFDDQYKKQIQGFSYINTLVDAFLLEKCSLEEHVTMHAVIRDMALWIRRSRVQMGSQF